VLSVPKLWIGAQRTEEGLLEGIFGTLAPELANEKGEHLVAMLVVEALERGDAHTTF